MNSTFVNEKKYSITNKNTLNLIIIIAVLSFYLNQYNSFIPGITLGELALIIDSLLVICIKGYKIKINKTKCIVAFYFVAFCLSIFMLFITPVHFHFTSVLGLFSRWIRYFAIVLFIIVLCQEVFDLDFFLRVYKIICIAVSIYTILQFVIFLFSHIYLPINILPIPFSREATTSDLIRNFEKYSFRAYGVFVEPSYLTAFLNPGVCLSLLGWKEREVDYCSFIVISLAIFMSTSVQGIVIWFVTLGFFVFSNRQLDRYLIAVRISTIIAILAIAFIIVKTGVSSNAFHRIETLISGGSLDKSSQMRVFRGFAFWSELPFENKLLGVGMGNIANYADTYNIVTPYDIRVQTEVAMEYMNGISSVLVSYGVIGFVLFIRIIIQLLKTVDFKGKIIIAQYILIMFSGSSFFTILSFFYIFVAMHFRVDKEEF